ncbi:MAG: DUF2191 domain-containing protein [Myxococcales bacterium]|nr:DUF2191 domain-containing protein [Myxococcales bacterium]
MVRRMKTTVELSPALLRRAKAEAAKRNTTLRELIEAGLAKELAARASKPTAFVLRDCSVGGDGLTAEAQSWSDVRDLLYAGRGGTK